MVYGYARVSTKGQDLYGNSLEKQEQDLRDAGCDVIYHDSFTGTKMERPEFSRLIAELKRGDKLVVAKLDRFARSAGQGITLIQELLNRGVAVHILNMGLIDNTSTGRLLVNVLLSFAEFERDMIVERTMAGKAVAKANKPGWREGRKEIEIDEELFRKLRAKQRRRQVTVSECCRQLGISESTWYNRVRESA